jgi:hypothetical protein
MDYDLTDVPATHDRGQDHGPVVLDQWRTVVESHVDPPAVHDILLATHSDAGPVVPIVEPIDFLIFGTAVERT